MGWVRQHQLSAAVHLDQHAEGRIGPTSLLACDALLLGNSPSDRAMAACRAAALAIPALVPLPVKEAEAEAMFA